MGLTLGRILLIVAVCVGGYYAYTQLGGKEKLDEATQQDPFNAAGLAFGSGLFEKALDKYERAVKAHPDDPRVVEAEFRIARCHEQLDHNAQARQLYLAFAEKHPGHAQAETARQRASKLELLNN